tara:strand:+ start:754 stop:1425 length:672 start_codon:yes stop_codon:yes gene_type:complete
MSVPIFLLPATFIDSDAANVAAYAYETTLGIEDDVDRIIALYRRIRDDIPYTPYLDYNDPHVFKASWALEEGIGFCISKAALLAACARALGIPARLGFADVRNHMTSARLRQFVGGDVMRWHAFAELFLKGKWVKATPAFNIGLCEKFGIKPLEFNGTEDSIFHPFTQDGQQHMEYIRERGSFSDVPLDHIMTCFRAECPQIFNSAFVQGDFAAEGAAEVKAS